MILTCLVLVSLLAAITAEDCKGKYEVGVAYPGNDLNNGRKSKKESPEECQALCKTFKKCNGWTWGADGDDCWVKKKLEKGKRTKNHPNRVSGTRNSCPGSSSGPGSGSGIGSGSGFGAGSGSGKRTGSGLETGKGSGSGSDCKGEYEVGVAYPGNDLNNGRESKKESPEKCQALCKTFKNCNGWTWGADGDDCWVKKKLEEGKRTKQYPNRVSGTRNSCLGSNSGSGSGKKSSSGSGIWTEGSQVNCWNGCGKKGGLCEKVCGSNGYCCRKGYNDCSKAAQKVAQKKHHSCLKSQGTWTEGSQVNCWNGCGKKGGLCEKVCGSNGYCCRKGHNDCSKPAQKVAQKNHHSCLKMQDRP